MFMEFGEFGVQHCFLLEGLSERASRKGGVFFW